jgi:predicted short-subunit dehydrogenase-like oxidoreductase (DUF2520 family)
MESIFSIQSINLIGSGNVAWVLGSALHNAGIKIQSVYSRNFTSCKALAVQLDSVPCNKVEDLKKADLILLAVSDDSIAEVSNKLSNKFNLSSQLIAHTSGSKPVSLLEPFVHKASFYPLQTMTKGNNVDFGKVHFCIHADHKEQNQALKILAEKLSPNVNVLDDKQRAILHLSAVMVNNFSNLFFTEAYELTNRNDINFDLLRPLILKTAQQAISNKPKDIQTGPAARNDKETINMHLELLEKDKELWDLYRKVSDRIIKNADSK